MLDMDMDMDADGDGVGNEGLGVSNSNSQPLVVCGWKINLFFSSSPSRTKNNQTERIKLVKGINKNNKMVVDF